MGCKRVRGREIAIKGRGREGEDKLGGYGEDWKWDREVQIELKDRRE